MDEENNGESSIIEGLQASADDGGGESEKNTKRNKKKKQNKEAKNKLKKKSAKAMKEMLKAIGKAIWAVIKWIGTILASLGWWVWLIILVVIIVIVIVVAITSYASAMFNGEYQNGLYSPGLGVKGDAFYGERYLYYDSAYSSEEMSGIYKEFTYNILRDVNEDSNYTISISFAIEPNNNQAINNITYSYAKALSGSNNEEYSLNYHTNLIDHYGFTELETQTVIANMSNYLVSNGLVGGGVTQEALALKIREVFDADYRYMKNVCSKIIIKDYLFEDAESGLKELPKKNYFGMVFMPNKDVTITDSAFVAILDNTRTADIAVKYKEGALPPETIEEATADETWFVDGKIDVSLDVDLSEYPLSIFEAIDENNINYLAEGKSLFTMLRENTFETYFNDTLGDYSEQALLENIKANNYIYLDIDADSYFIITDSYSEYE